VKNKPTTVLNVLITEATYQLVTNVHLDSSMIPSMLIVNLVNQPTTDVYLVMEIPVTNVKPTELLHTVPVPQDSLKSTENVSTVPTTVSPVPVSNPIVLNVLKEESLLQPVSVHTDSMMT